MDDFHTQLITTFKNQYLFSRDYSPLYTSFFAAIGGWLEEDPPDPVGAWLLEASYGRRPLDTSLLLAAGLHRDILEGRPELIDLADYYPSVGGYRSAGHAMGGDWKINREYQRILNNSILARRAQLQTFIQTSQVQTNETGRGISWLLPLSLAGWTRAHLLDFGASAGLNLLAEKRSYQFVGGENEQIYCRLGEGEPVQFETRSEVSPDVFDIFPKVVAPSPQIVSRQGCDLMPFFLHTPGDEQTLAAFVWADQSQRMKRLREGIAAYHQAEMSTAPVQLYAVELPGELPDFLERHIRKDAEPLICYNTYIRMYLPEKGFALRHHLGVWARKQPRPVVWIQWEPPSSLNDHHGKAPEYGWLAWTIDLWHRGQEHHWHIAWVHPHGQQVHWLPDLQGWFQDAARLPQ